MFKTLLITLLATTSLAIASDDTADTQSWDDNGSSFSSDGNMKDNSGLMSGDESTNKGIMDDESVMNNDMGSDTMDGDMSMSNNKLMDEVNAYGGDMNGSGAGADMGGHSMDSN